ncbi:Zn(II)2Cys6 transcription factor [Aspergillus tanneri]|uniref:Zn(2)-C6 fungal-type domain-containing protein n=1 Tax=Aspergillus tanneri TaxID=1220188 RepID=A0A5M9NBT7_9EURO|nr:uncharacterized protein ATNIH1004_000867 [Aspergillus tanneri]KAA8651967.1 hypothetical protein ATNIH1004_000867 [Aspergillus tanneri]
MADALAPYACDKCRSRKVACSRDRPGCQRCKAQGIACSYSRSGVIRRSRKQKEKNRLPTHNCETPTGTERTGLRQPPLPASDNVGGTTYERLQRLVGKDHRSLRALASLLEEYAAAWQGSSAFDKLAEGAEADFFLFEEDQVRAWVDVFVTTLQKERLVLTSAPSEVLDHLVASRPHQVHDRAWLVMFYSVTLSVVSSTNPSDESTKANLRSNLWLAFNDVRLLLEPNVSSIQALVILACHVEEYMTPSLCWVLVTKACVMLQALGVTHWRLDSPTRERRTMLFWRLNTLDKSLALILCRPPTFHREMATGIALPTLEQLLHSQPYHPSSGAPALFEAHYMYQMHLLSRVMADVWHCLYGQDSDDVHTIKENLESWHLQATEVLEAAALAEKPLLTASGTASVDLGLQTLHFHYYSLLVLLTVSYRQLRTQSTYPSQQMLGLLPGLGAMLPGLKEPYTCLLWQRLHCPLAAFGILWGEIVIKGRAHFEQSEQSLEAIEHLPAFLGKQVFIREPQWLCLTYMSLKDEADQEAPNPSIPTQRMPESQQSVSENLDQNSNTSIALALSNNSTGDNFDSRLDDLFTWTGNSFIDFIDDTFDWISWANQV